MALKIDLPNQDSNSKYNQVEFYQQQQKQFLNIIEDPRYGFFKVIRDQELIHSCQQVYAQHIDRVKTFVQVGIGGSSLGPEMVTSALKTNNVKLLYINNIDPDTLYSQLQQIDTPEETLFYFVSKSGGTAETMAALAIITNWLKEHGITNQDLHKYYVFATDPVKSDLLNLGKELEITCLTIPSNVGGRFSVLTPVGYLPALFAGVNIEQLVRGAQDMANHILNDNLQENALYRICSYLLEEKEKGCNQTVFMPYSSELRNLSFWFVQLWAESLGKKYNLNGKEVFEGLTPIPAYGATDQHSQMQLFMEGPRDKVLFMLNIASFKHDYSLENCFGTPSLLKLSHFTLTQLMEAEFHGTLTALKEANRPFIHLEINTNDAHNLGALILFCESLTALMGYSLNIDPFNQPGVEAGKKYAFEWLEGKS